MSRDLKFLILVNIAIIVGYLFIFGRVSPDIIVVGILVLVLWIVFERSGLYGPRPRGLLLWQRMDQRTQAVHRSAATYTLVFLVLVLGALAFFYGNMPVNLLVVLPVALALALAFYFGIFVILARRR